jgi:transcriptional regulator with XRE-family HTH domain
LSRSSGGSITFQVIEPGTTVFYDARMAQQRQTIGEHLREWRQRRRMSQLDLALEAGISTRHLSFVETGRALPSRDMLLHLAEQLGVPMRERNVLLVAAGYAPMFPERSLRDPALAAARAAIDLVLDRQKPYPAFALDRHWCIAASNTALPELYTGVAPELLEPPVNGLRLSLHPRGMAPRIVNLAEWRAHLLFRLRRQIEITADPVLRCGLRRASRTAPFRTNRPLTTLRMMVPSKRERSRYAGGQHAAISEPVPGEAGAEIFAAAADPRIRRSANSERERCT